MNYPDESTLVARGKQATALKERREQIQRVQEICRTVQGNATLILTDCQKRPPEDMVTIERTIKALENASKAQFRIIELSREIDSLEQEAWGSPV